MKGIDSIKILTLALRGTGIASRFLLTFLITKLISLEFQGLYTLVVTTITLLIIFFGFDFYIHVTKSAIRRKKNEVFFLKNMLIFFFFSYIMLFGFLSIGFSLLELESIPFWTLYFLIVFEHLGQEFFRIYLALKKPLLANVLLFIRTGLWALIVVIKLLFLENTSITIKEILLYWLISAILTCLLGFVFYPNIKSFFIEKIDFEWIKKGVIIGLTMFASTICLKIIEYSDRYLIDFYLSKKEVGIYSFYFQLSNVVNVVIFTMYISFLYPDIIKGVYDKSFNSVSESQNIIKKKTLMLVIISAILFFILSPFLLDYINKPELKEFSKIFYIMLISTLFLNYSFASHYVIIGADKENLIFKATLYACFINVSLNLILIPIIGIYGSAFAVLLSNFILFLLKKNHEKRIITLW